MTYRDDLAALEARHGDLEREVASKTDELTRATQLLEEARERTRLPVLPNIRVASPCSADWAAMTGDDRVRACAQCDKPVFNLSNMTRDEAEALIVEKQGKLCARYYQRTDGTILLKDCMIGVARKRKQRVAAVGAMALLAGGGALAYRATHGPAAESSAVQFAEVPRSEYRVVQTVEPPPDEVEIKVIHQKPTAKEIEEAMPLQGDVSFDPGER